MHGNMWNPTKSVIDAQEKFEKKNWFHQSTLCYCEVEKFFWKFQSGLFSMLGNFLAWVFFGKVFFSTRSYCRGGWQAKMVSIEFWIPWRNPHRPCCCCVWPLKQGVGWCHCSAFCCWDWGSRSVLLYAQTWRSSEGTVLRTVSHPLNHHWKLPSDYCKSKKFRTH